MATPVSASGQRVHHREVADGVTALQHDPVGHVQDRGHQRGEQPCPLWTFGFQHQQYHCRWAEHSGGSAAVEEDEPRSATFDALPGEVPNRVQNRRDEHQGQGHAVHEEASPERSERVIRRYGLDPTHRR